MSQNDIEQSSKNSLPSVLRDFLSAWQRDEIDDMLPAKVISYNDSTNRAIIKPLVQMGTADGRKIDRPNQVNVPVFRFGGGGFFIRMPIKPGDFGWLKANDRDISLIMQRGGLEDWPNTLRTHDFNDSMFFPDSLKGWAIDGSYSNSLVIQSLSGGAVFAVSDNEIELKVGSQILNLSSAGLTHNGVNIGSNHTHGGVETGGGNTGGPQ